MLIYTYDELPLLAKKALDVYPYLDCEFYRNYTYKLYDVTMSEAVVNVMSYEELNSSYSNFEEYHFDYCKSTLPIHELQYPVFHEPSNNYEWLSDGWHRLHSYYRSGFDTVPVMEILY